MNWGRLANGEGTRCLIDGIDACQPERLKGNFLFAAMLELASGRR